MKSDRPKVLYPVCGQPMIQWVMRALRQADVEEIAVVVGYRAEDVEDELKDVDRLEFVHQTEQLGTGHAVLVCGDWLKQREGNVLIVAGDSPLLQADSVNALFDHAESQGTAGLLGTLKKDNPFGLGRIVRDDQDQFIGIVEEKDATDEQRAICEVNMSTYVFDCRELEHALGKLTNDNKQGEYYLTDCPGILKREGKPVDALPVLKDCESLSINTVDEAALVEVEMQKLGYS